MTCWIIELVNNPFNWRHCVGYFILFYFNYPMHIRHIFQHQSFAYFILSDSVQIVHSQCQWTRLKRQLPHVWRMRMTCWSRIHVDKSIPSTCSSNCSRDASLTQFLILLLSTWRNTCLLLEWSSNKACCMQLDSVRYLGILSREWGLPPNVPQNRCCSSPIKRRGGGDKVDDHNWRRGRGRSQQSGSLSRPSPVGQTKG